MTASEMKRIVGENVIDQEFAEGHLHSGTVERPFRVGIGTGSTAIWAIRRLAERVAAGQLAHLVCVATSTGSQLEGQKLGLRVTDLNDPAVDGAVDWAFDGADQVSPQGCLIKGGGAAHTREKLVEHNAGRFVVLVDASKIVDRLGGDPAHGGFAVPVEVLPLALTQVCRSLEGFGARVAPRETAGKAGPIISDNGLVIVDAVFPNGLITSSKTDPHAMETAIKRLPGVLEVGIFTCPVAAVYVGKQDGTVERIEKFSV